MFQMPKVVVLAAGTVVADKYELLRLLDRGGMSEVWAARHRSLGEDVAIKFLVPPSRNDPDAMLSRFQLEARIAAHLSRRSRHIASVIDSGVAGDTAYLVMELLDGVSLETLIDSGEHRDLPYVSMIVNQLAKGLSIAHDEGVVHRDLKPANAMLTSDDETGNPFVKILDFGIGKLDGKPSDVRSFGGARALNRHSTLVGAPLGTPEYMSPEQVRAIGDVDWRCDVWALAVVTYQLLSGVSPFEGRSITDTMFRVLTGTRDPILTHRPDLPETARAIFDRAFAPELEDRFPTALAFAEAIRALMDEEQTLAPVSTPPASVRVSEVRELVRATTRTDPPIVCAPARRQTRGRFLLVGGVALGQQLEALDVGGDRWNA